MQQTVNKKYFELPDDDPVVYHYTSASALISILRSSSLYASNVLFMNDPGELEHSVDMAWSVIEGTSHDPDPKLNDLYVSYYKEYFETKIAPRSQRQFVLSFSLDPDSLHLWNMYSHSDGYAIGFRLSRLVDGMLTPTDEQNDKKTVKLDDHNAPAAFGDYSVYFGRVLYAMSEQKQLVVDSIPFIDRAIAAVGAKLSSNPSDPSTRYLSYFIQTLVSALYNMKAEPHAVEKEYRITIVPDATYRGVQYKDRNGIVTPYVRIGPIVDAIDTVVIGPLMKDKAAHQGVMHLLSTIGAQRIRVSHSAIRLR